MVGGHKECCQREIGSNYKELSGGNMEFGRGRKKISRCHTEFVGEAYSILWSHSDFGGGGGPNAVGGGL